MDSPPVGLGFSCLLCRSLGWLCGWTEGEEEVIGLCLRSGRGPAWQLSWLEYRPTHQQVAGPVSDQGTYLSGRQPISVFLSLPPFLSLQSQ